MKTLASFLATALVALPAAAQVPHWYVGAAAGQSKAGSQLVSDREAAIGGGNEPNMQTSSDLKDTAGKLWAGYRLSPNFALEAHWTSLGNQRIENTFDVPFGATGKGGVLTEREVEGWGADLLGGIEPAPGFWLFGRAGAFRAEVKTDTTISGDTRFADGTEGNFRSVKQSETVLKLGVGGEYAVNPNLVIRLEWERFLDVGKRLTPENSSNTGEADHDAVWLGVGWRF
jgi:opacity protein-like surface antigen